MFAGRLRGCQLACWPGLDPESGHTEGRGLTAQGALIEIDPCIAVIPTIRRAL